MRAAGLIAVSLGAAAALLGTKPIQADAIVLEAVYSTFECAVENRIAMRIGDYGRILAPLFLWQIKPRLGISTASLSPLAAISQLAAPVFILGGTEDRHSLPSESFELFSRARLPKSIWMVEAAKHQDLYKYVPDQYEYRILEFFEKNLH